MKKTTKRRICGFIFLGILLFILVPLNLAVGSVRISIPEISRILFGGINADTAGRIIWDIRLPRLIAAVILGGGLAVSGFLLQTFFANPIAGPFVLGISSGSKLLVALAMVILLKRSIVMSSLGMAAMAFLGALLSMSFVLFISGRVRKISYLIICGVMISYICSAVTDFVVTFADDSNIVNLHNWSLGSFSGISWNHVRVMTLITIPAFFLVLLLSKQVEAYLLGEVYAINLGIDIKKFRAALVLLSSLLAGTVTAFAGPISFVGIAVPHLIRMLFNTSKPLIVIPGCFLGGAVFCLFSDLIARCAFSPLEISISSVTALIGAPVVIRIMLLRQKRQR